MGNKLRINDEYSGSDYQWEIQDTSTRPVYNRIPALSESSTPLTMEAVVLPGLYVLLTPRPTAMPNGVVIPYNSAAQMAT